MSKAGCRYIQLHSSKELVCVIQNLTAPRGLSVFALLLASTYVQCTVLQTNLVGKLLERPEKGTDMDDRVLGGYCQQCVAEAQEGLLLLYIVVARLMLCLWLIK